MNLADYLQTLSDTERRDFRRSVLRLTGVKYPAWHQWLTRTTQPSPRNARQLVLLSDHVLTLEALRPKDYE